MPSASHFTCRPRSRSRLVGTLAPLLAAVALLAAPPAFAQHEKAVASELHTYWVRQAYAVQPRAFSRARAVELTALLGVVPTDPLRTYFLVGARMLYNLSERLGLGADFDYWLAADKPLLADLPGGTGAGSYQRARPRWRAGGVVQWTPLYGKLSAYGRVVHIELHLLAGAGATYTLEEPTLGAQAGVRPAFNLGTGLGLLLGSRWLLHLDYRQHLYLGPPAPLRGDEAELAWPAAFQLGFGVLLGGQR